MVSLTLNIQSSLPHINLSNITAKVGCAGPLPPCSVQVKSAPTIRYHWDLKNDLFCNTIQTFELCWMLGALLTGVRDKRGVWGIVEC